MNDGFFAWLPPLIHTKEPELLDKIGFDAVTYLRFLRLLRWLFTAIAILTCVILLPINISYNLRNGVKHTTALSMMTVQAVRGDVLFVHVAVMYLISKFSLSNTEFIAYGNADLQILCPSSLPRSRFRMVPLASYGSSSTPMVPFR